MYFQPKLFVFENVPGLISANRGEAFRTILSDLQRLEEKRKDCLGANAPYSVPDSPVSNYVILFRSIVDAVRLGVPQIRRRLILVGLREDLYYSLSANSRVTAINGIEQQLYGANMLFARYPLTSLEAFEGKPLTALQSEYRQVMQEYHDVADGNAGPRAAEWKKSAWRSLRFDAVQDYLMQNQLDGTFSFSITEFEKAMQEHEQLLHHLGWTDTPVKGPQLSDNTQAPPKQSPEVVRRMFQIPPDENAEFVAGTPWEVESKDISFIYRRTSPLKPAMTVMAYGGGGTHGYHYERNRSALTLRERARIQTFTDDFLFSGVHVRAQIGEAVPPLLGERIAVLLRDILALTTSRPRRRYSSLLCIFGDVFCGGNSSPAHSYGQSGALTPGSVSATLLPTLAYLRDGEESRHCRRPSRSSKPHNCSISTATPCADW